MKYKIPWSKKEIEILRKYYYLEKDLSARLPGRTRVAITSKVSWLRKRGFTFNEKI